MTEQLNERERQLIRMAIKFGYHAWQAEDGCGRPSVDDFMFYMAGAGIPEAGGGYMAHIATDPNLARITELEAEVERLNEMYGKAVKIPSHILDRRDDEICRLYAEVARLNGLLGEVDGLCVARAYLEIGQPALLNGLFDILSRRTAERKEQGDGA